jgi:hypothetical protein
VFYVHSAARLIFIVNISISNRKYWPNLIPNFKILVLNYFYKGITVKLSILLTLLLLVTSAFADSTYYPTAFIQAVASGKVQNDDLKNQLNLLLTSNHQKDSKGGSDTIGCATPGVGGCYAQRSLGYDGARRVLFGKLDLRNDGGKYYIKDVYCQKIYSKESGVGPDLIPNNNIINCEHTWPQSKFSNKYPADIQKADMHHLYASDSHANSVRGNNDFTDVNRDHGDLAGCTNSKSGASATGGNDGFEPPLAHKGNVARAKFYFSVRYKISIPKNEEETLRRWNELDPVDQDEMDRNNGIYSAQGNRNPFVDYPQLVHYISKF